MKESLCVISALGEDKPGFVKALSKTVLDCGGNISDSRMTHLGNEFALIMLVEGSEEIISAVENAISQVQQAHDLTVVSKRTQVKAVQEERIPYKVNVVSMDHPGIVHNVTDFIAQQHINIEELDTSSYAAAHTGAPMFSLAMSISIPKSLNIGKFKKDFLFFCDELNLDAVVEAIK